MCLWGLASLKFIGQDRNKLQTQTELDVITLRQNFFSNFYFKELQLKTLSLLFNKIGEKGKTGSVWK
jgi:hypothetical protein